MTTDAATTVQPPARVIPLSVNRDTVGCMRSLRLDPDLDQRVQSAAAREGVSVSEFLRRAAAERADRTLRETKPSEALAFFIGAGRSSYGGSIARNKDALLDEIYAEKLQRRRGDVR